MGVLAEVGVNFWVCMEWNSGVGIKFLLFFLGGGGFSPRKALSCRRGGKASLFHFLSAPTKSSLFLFFRHPQSPGVYNSLARARI